MLLAIFAVAGFAGGVVLTRKHKKRFDEFEAGTTASMVRKVVADSRKSLVIGHTIVRMQLTRAFMSTARRYAPVPLTFSHAVLSSYIPILATASGGTIIVVAFCRFAASQLHSRTAAASSGPPPGAQRAEDRENVLVASLEAVAGLLLYTSGKAAWRAGPLRGGLSVFGAAPDLDRAASKERYLAEKLAAFGEALTGGATSLASLSHLKLSRDDVNGTVTAMVRYARRAMGVQGRLVSPEFSEAWAEFSVKTATHGREMRRISDGVYYPKVHGVNVVDSHAVLGIVNLTDPLLKFSKSSQDTAAVLAGLLKELGGARGGWVASMLSSLLLGACVGTELTVKLL